MSSWVSRSLEHAISLITEMIRPSKDIILQKHFDELHNILMDTAKDIVMEMESLEKDRDFIKAECLLLERMNALSESNKLKVQDELQKSQKECEDLKEKLARLRDKNIISDLNEKIGKLKNQILDRDHKIGMCQQNLKFSERKIAEIEKENKDLKDEKLEADKIKGEMRLKQIEANYAMDELRQKNLEAFETSKKLRCQMLAAEIEKTRYEEIMEDAKCKEFEAEQKVEELRRRNVEACDVIEGLRNRILAFEADRRRSDQIIMEMKLKQMENDQTVDNHTRENFEAIEELKRVIVKKSMESKEAKEANTPVFNGEKRNLENGSSISTERALQKIEIIEVIDSEDEAIPSESTCNSNIHANLDEKEKISAFPSSSQPVSLVDFFPKRKRSSRANGIDEFRGKKKQIPISTQEKEVSLNTDLSRKPNSGFARIISPSKSKPVIRICEEKGVSACESRRQLCKSNSLNNGNSSDSDDDSCSDSHMDEMVRSVRCEKLLSKT